MNTQNINAFVTLIVSAISAFSLQFQTGIIKVLSYSDCDRPIYYNLGELDPKFGLNRTTVSADIQNATDIWNKAYGKTLFVDSSPGALTINFVYDERSALITKIDDLQNQLNQKGPTLQQKINAYESSLALFKQKLNNFNNEVAQINKSGGASPNLYKNLIAQQNELITEGNSLNELASKLNLATYDFNSKVQTLNQSVNQFNQTLEQKPEEGLYDPNDHTITIYLADNQKELIHTLAHEFGHTLGIQHTTDPQSIMYLYTSSFTGATQQDKQELDYVCREQLLPVLWLNKFSLWISNTLRAYISK